MNFDGSGAHARREAALKYLDAEFRILREGDFVRCASTGNPIPLVDLRYWDVLRQRPYGSAAAAFAERLKSA